MNMGENCSQGSRLIVHRSVQDELVSRLAEGLAAWTVGDPMDPATKIGPMIERPHLDKVMGYIDRGRAEGARVVSGGSRVLEDTGGYFVAPTIFDGVTNDMTIAREEIFGPVLSTIPFDSEEEGIRLANETAYGLAASVFTKDLDAAFRVARAVRAGTVGVNAYSEGDITTPFGGYKQSGFGGRDKGLEALEQYTEKKTIGSPPLMIPARALVELCQISRGRAARRGHRGPAVPREAPGGRAEHDAPDVAAQSGLFHAEVPRGVNLAASGFASVPEPLTTSPAVGPLGRLRGRDGRNRAVRGVGFGDDAKPELMTKLGLLVRDGRNAQRPLARTTTRRTASRFPLWATTQ